VCRLLFNFTYKELGTNALLIFIVQEIETLFDKKTDRSWPSQARKNIEKFNKNKIFISEKIYILYNN